MACTGGRKLEGGAYHTVLAAGARERPFLTDHRVVTALSKMDMSVQRTRTDWATCSAWLFGVVASRSISEVKSEEAASLPSRVNIRFHTGSEEAEVLANLALLMAMRNSIRGYIRTDLCRVISVFHCCAERELGAGAVSPS